MQHHTQTPRLRWKDQWHWLVLVAVLLFSAWINVATLHDGHNWGDDFGQYLIHTQNLIDAQPYNQGILLEDVNTFPPGYPLLLAPILKLFGLNFVMFKIWNLLFWYGSIFMLFYIFEKQLNRNLALLCSIFFLTSSSFFLLKQNVVADIPFFFFVTATIYVYTRYVEKDFIFEKPELRKKFFFMLLLMSCALLINPAGWCLFLATFFYYSVIKRNTKALTWTGIFLVITMLIQAGLTGSLLIGWPQAFVSSPSRFLQNMVTYSPTVFQSIGWFVLPGLTIMTDLFWYLNRSILGYATPVLILAIIVLFVHHSYHKKISFMGIFTCFYVTVIGIWVGFGGNPGGFSRFTIPIIAPSLIYLFILGDTLQRTVFKKSKTVLLGRLFAWTLIMFISLNIFNIDSVYKFQNDVIHHPDTKELLTWIDDNMHPDEHYLFSKPRALALLTHRTGGFFYERGESSRADLAFRILELDVSYIIAQKQDDEAFINFLERSPDGARIIWENEFYKVFVTGEKLAALEAQYNDLINDVDLTDFEFEDNFNWKNLNPEQAPIDSMSRLEQAPASAQPVQ